MTLLKQVERVCRRLARHGWADLFAAHGLDISKRDLARELARPLRKIDRTLPGFADFCAEGTRGVEPGSPARSLLYHALASPAVVSGPRGKLRAFPTLAELEAVENYVWARRKTTLAAIQADAGDRPLAVAVFAAEYRTARRTPHRRYADLAYSRTGLARVGTAPARYEPAARGFTPLMARRPDRIRVSPARYAVYLAVQVPGSRQAHRPMRFQGPDKSARSPGDDKRDFWVPVHKLFDGDECLVDQPGLRVQLAARHVNEKLRRIHVALGRRTVGGKRWNTGWAEPVISSAPFRFTDGIAELSPGPDDPPGLLVPVVHPSLVEPATYRGKPLGYNVPPRDGFVASLDIPAHYNELGEEIRSAPAYVHARTRMSLSGEENLNAEADAATEVDKGGYMARHYVDYTGDGWVAAKVAWSARPTRLGKPLPAYSLVTAPDFFVSCDQVELSDWAESLPPRVASRLWYMPPTPLSDIRLPANLQLPRTPFAAADETITAVVAGDLEPAPGEPVTGLPAEHPRHTTLPDDAAGVMAPGWDVARDWLPDDHTQHLANYGLGSPFPEDSKLCAALSSFWPAVAPDATRQFAWTETQEYRSVTPLTDEEIGAGDIPAWDDVAPPRLAREGGHEYAVYANFAHADYTLSAVAGRLSLAATGRITQRDYADRTLAMATAYRALGASHYRWVVLSYRHLHPEHRERRRAERATGCQLTGTAHRFAVFYAGSNRTESKPPFRRRLRVRRKATLLVDPSTGDVLIEREGKWSHKKVSW